MGSVAIPEQGRESSRCIVLHLCGEPAKLLGERQPLTAGIFRLGRLLPAGDDLALGDLPRLGMIDVDHAVVAIAVDPGHLGP